MIANCHTSFSPMFKRYWREVAEVKFLTVWMVTICIIILQVQMEMFVTNSVCDKLHSCVSSFGYPEFKTSSALLWEPSDFWTCHILPRMTLDTQVHGVLSSVLELSWICQIMKPQIHIVCFYCLFIKHHLETNIQISNKKQFILLYQCFPWIITRFRL